MNLLAISHQSFVYKQCFHGYNMLFPVILRQYRRNFPAKSVRVTLCVRAVFQSTRGCAAFGWSANSTPPATPSHSRPVSLVFSPSKLGHSDKGCVTNC